MCHGTGRKKQIGNTLAYAMNIVAYKNAGDSTWSCDDYNGILTCTSTNGGQLPSSCTTNNGNGQYTTWSCKENSDYGNTNYYARWEYVMEYDVSS